MKLSHNVVLFYFEPEDSEIFKYWFDDTVNDAMIAFNERINYEINIVTDRKGTIFGYAYIRIDSQKLINILEDKQPNGSSRIVKRQKLIEDSNNTWNEYDIVEEEIEIPPFMRFYPMYINVFPTFMGRAKIKPVEDDKQHNVIFSLWDTSIKVDDIYAIFKLYDTSNTKHYPKINTIPKSALVFITFDPKTTDCQNSMLVQRKTVINDKVLYFSFAKIR
jgi:hypothetical protein